MTQMNNQGMTAYPQYTTNFWGSSSDNNYGFGTSNISNNIENMQTMTPIPHNKKTALMAVLIGGR